jgi:hypothetical protein
MSVMGTNKVSARVRIGGPMKPDGTYETNGTYVSDRTRIAGSHKSHLSHRSFVAGTLGSFWPGFEGDLTLIIKKATDL